MYSVWLYLKPVYFSVLLEWFEKQQQVAANFAIHHQFSQPNGILVKLLLFVSSYVISKKNFFLPITKNVLLCVQIQLITNSESNSNSLQAKTNLFYLQRTIDTLRNVVLNKSLFLAPKGFVS